MKAQPKTAQPVLAVTNKTPYKRVCHGYLESEALAAFARTTFVKSVMTDTDFASKATKTLGFVVKASHVATVRTELGYPSLRSSGAAAAATGHPALSNRITGIEATIAGMAKAQAEILALLTKAV